MPVALQGLIILSILCIHANSIFARPVESDPFEIGEGWFEILLPSLQLVTTEHIPPHIRPKAEYTLKRLKLGNGERVIRRRRSWLELYQEGMLELSGLKVVAPLIATAIKRKAESATS